MTKTEDGILQFELEYLGVTKSMTHPDLVVRRSTFLADAVASNDVHLLQIRMDSYEEFRPDGSKIPQGDSGYWFVRVLVDDEAAEV